MSDQVLRYQFKQVLELGTRWKSLKQRPLQCCKVAARETRIINKQRT